MADLDGFMGEITPAMLHQDSIRAKIAVIFTRIESVRRSITESDKIDSDVRASITRTLGGFKETFGASGSFTTGWASKAFPMDSVFRHLSLFTADCSGIVYFLKRLDETTNPLELSECTHMLEACTENMMQIMYGRKDAQIPLHRKGLHGFFGDHDT